MHHLREGLSTRLRMIAALLSLGSLLSFGLGQALGHLPAPSGTAAHVAADQRPAAGAGGSLATAKLATSRPRSAPTPRVTRDGDGGHADHAGHAGDHGHAGKHSKPHELSEPPKGGTNGGTVGSSGGDAHSTD